MEWRNYASVLNYGMPENFNAPLYDKFLEALVAGGYQFANDWVVVGLILC